MNRSKASVSIIGFGKLGQALYRVLRANGYPVRSVFSRTKRAMGEYLAEKPTKTAELGDLIFITVPDDHLQSVIDDLNRLSDDFSGKAAVHCSGTLNSDLFEPLRRKGAVAASFHPNAAVTAATDSFAGIRFDAEGDAEALEILKQLCGDIRAELLPITKEAKPYLHAAAVTASNYLVTLLDTAAEIAKLGGMDTETALKALMPLVESTLGNLEQNTPRHALTGPIARGDYKTVETHLALLSKTPELLATYKTLGRATLKLSKAPQAQLDRLRALLKS